MATNVVVQGTDDSVLRFAADEMIKYAAKVTGENASRGEPGPDANIFLRVDAAAGAGDSFVLRSTADGLVIMSELARGVLYGVYAYLESLGVRFPFPGEAHEVIPRRPLAMAGYDQHEAPSFAKRGMTFSGDVEHARQWIDFCGKQRMNWVFHHTQFEDHWWVENRPVLWPELQKRGITLELGGHYLPHFIPRALFRQHPDWFRFANGGRVNEYNFCPSSHAAMEYLKARVRQYVQEQPEAEVYNVWADDTAEDSSTWCFCTQCQQYSPSDQNLLVMNAMAEAVCEVKPTGKLVCIAYHETLTPPQKVEPAPNVVLMFAPRERCYAHALNDPNCAKNQQHAHSLEALVKVFDPGQAEIFEYYPDQVVFNHMMPALADTIASDIHYYKSLGIGLIEPLLTPFSHPWISPPPSAILQSRALWSVDANLHDTLADYARTYFGDEVMVAYFNHRERALHRVIQACDFSHPVAAFWTPPHDQPDVTERHLMGLKESLADLRQARKALAQASRVAVNEYVDRIHKEEEAFNLASRRVHGQLHYAEGVLAYHRFEKTYSREEGDAAIRHLEHAYADLNETLLYGGQPWRTFRFADTLIQRILLTTESTKTTLPTAAQLVNQMPAALIPERVVGHEGIYQFLLGGEGGGAWTVEIHNGQCTVQAGMATQPSATLQMPAMDFVALLLGEVTVLETHIWGQTQLTGDAVSLMRLPSVFRFSFRKDSLRS
jgi:hypothetical protein